MAAKSIAGKDIGFMGVTFCVEVFPLSRLVQGLAIIQRWEGVSACAYRREAGVGRVRHRECAPHAWQTCNSRGTGVFDRLKAVLHQCAIHGPSSQNYQRIADFRAHLLGRIAWIGQFSPTRKARLMRLFERIEWDGGGARPLSQDAPSTPSPLPAPSPSRR
jgi:hypothetical protein